MCSVQLVRVRCRLISTSCTRTRVTCEMWGSVRDVGRGAVCEAGSVRGLWRSAEDWWWAGRVGAESRVAMAGGLKACVAVGRASAD